MAAVIFTVTHWQSSPVNIPGGTNWTRTLLPKQEFVGN